MSSVISKNIVHAGQFVELISTIDVKQPLCIYSMGVYIKIYEIEICPVNPDHL